MQLNGLVESALGGSEYKQWQNKSTNTLYVFCSKNSSDDYDTPWEWKQKMQQSRMKVPKPTAQTQRPKSSHEQDRQPSTKPTDDYDEPWEKKQSYLLKTQVPKPRSPVPLPRQTHPQSNDSQLYEQPWDAMNQPNGQQPQAEGVYETPWEATGGGAANGRASPRRFSQPASSTGSPASTNRKFSQPVIPSAPSDDYDTPWEYKNKQFGVMGPPKPIRLHEIANSQPVDPNLPLNQQR